MIQIWIIDRFLF